MAYTRIHAIKSTLKKALDYIENPNKTDEELLVTGYNVNPQFASTEFEMTVALSKEMKGDYTKTGSANNLAYHMIQSFSPDDNITPQQAHEIGKKWANEILGGMYEYVLSTHRDKGHIHNHIIFNATSFYHYKKFETKPYKTAQKLREVSDKLCVENNLNVIRNPKNKGVHYSEWSNRNAGTSWKAQLANLIDKAILNADNYDHFKRLLDELGVVIKEGKHIAFNLKSLGQERFTRGKTIGEDYTREAIIKRISDPNKHASKNEMVAETKMVEVKTAEPEAPTNSYDHQIEHASRKTRLANTKKLANALLLIRKEGIQSYGDFDARIDSLKEQVDETKLKIREADKKNLQYKEAAKYLLAIRKYAPIMRDYEKSFSKKGFLNKYESEITAYNHAVEQLSKFGVRTNVDPDKVIDLVKDQDFKIGEMKTAFTAIDNRITEIRNARTLVDMIHGEAMGIDMGRTREINKAKEEQHF